MINVNIRQQLYRGGGKEGAVHRRDCFFTLLARVSASWYVKVLHMSLCEGFFWYGCFISQ